MGARARDRRQFDRLWDGNGQWGMSKKLLAYIDRKTAERERPALRVLIHKGRKP